MIGTLAPMGDEGIRSAVVPEADMELHEIASTRVLNELDTFLLITLTLAEAMSPEPTADDLNDLFDYDIGLDEVFPDTTATNNASKPSAPGDSASLGLDEEVKVTKKRQPVAKLDEAR